MQAMRADAPLPPKHAIRALGALFAAASVVSCGGGPKESPTPSPTRPNTTTEREPAREQPEAEAQPALDPPPCPPALTGCRRAAGTVLYVERVDPDGDGDAHFVLLSEESVTAPGITVLDVRRDLRPHPLPGPGDRLAAAGPVHTGSYGQRQIEAVAVRVAP